MSNKLIADIKIDNDKMWLVYNDGSEILLTIEETKKVAKLAIKFLSKFDYFCPILEENEEHKNDN